MLYFNISFSSFFSSSSLHPNCLNVRLLTCHPLAKQKIKCSFFFFFIKTCAPSPRWCRSQRAKTESFCPPLMTAPSESGTWKHSRHSMPSGGIKSGSEVSQPTAAVSSLMDPTTAFLFMISVLQNATPKYLLILFESHFSL